MPINLVFVHGWSVTNLNTYGQLPIRLRNELAANAPGNELAPNAPRNGPAAGAGDDSVTLHEIWLGRYISFHDEVRLTDISRAFQAAVDDQLAPLIAKGERFACITHSTGGPVIRDWWNRYWKGNAKACPMSHCIMLAPANFGSALARLGKGTIGRLRSWMGGVEPGQGVLDWLELGSQGSWDLNSDWIVNAKNPAGANGFYPFVLIGQSIDRKFYDHLNTYTGEIGSDGVVRSAAANLNAAKVVITQKFITNPDGTLQDADPWIEYYTAPPTPFLVVKGKSHSGTEMGIMASVQAERPSQPPTAGQPPPDTSARQVPPDTSAQQPPIADQPPAAGQPPAGGQPPQTSPTQPPPDPTRELLTAILSCLRVTNDTAYTQLIADFSAQTDANQRSERLELVTDLLISLKTRYFIHDRYCMVIFRLTDTEGNPIPDYDLLFTAGDNNPNHLPEGFFADRQQNSRHKETITYFVNYDILKGADPVKAGKKQVRERAPGIKKLGLQVNPRPDSGFVPYRPLEILAQPEFFEKMIRPNSTILLEIRLQRLVSKQVFRLASPPGPLGHTMPDNKGGDFKDTTEGQEFVC